MVSGGKTDVTTEVTVVCERESEGEVLSVSVCETLDGLTTGPDEPDEETEAMSHIASRMLLTRVWSAALHDVVPAHCSTLDANDVLHRHGVSVSAHPTVDGAWSAHPDAHCGRVVACPAADKTTESTTASVARVCIWTTWR